MPPAPPTPHSRATWRAAHPAGALGPEAQALVHAVEEEAGLEGRQGHLERANAKRPEQVDSNSGGRGTISRAVRPCRRARGS